MPEVPRTAIRVPLSGANQSQTLCTHCDYLTMTRDGAHVIFSDWEPTHVGVRSISTGTESEFLKHSKYTVFQPLLTRDNRWVVFYLRIAPGTTQIFAAPFHGTQRIPESAWIPITDGTTHDTTPVWSPDEQLVYFGSERDGHQCIWAQRVAAKTKSPAGPPFGVAHFHSAAHRIQNLGTVQRAMAISRDRLVFPMDELTGNIWLLER